MAAERKRKRERIWPMRELESAHLVGRKESGGPFGRRFRHCRLRVRWRWSEWWAVEMIEKGERWSIYGNRRRWDMIGRWRKNRERPGVWELVGQSGCDCFTWISFCILCCLSLETGHWPPSMMTVEIDDFFFSFFSPKIIVVPRETIFTRSPPPN